MKPLIHFEVIGKKKIENYDAIIYIPHGSLETDFIEKVRETSQINLDAISNEMLYKYLYHEADTGVYEITDEIKKYFQNSDFSIWILKVEIPRGYCDLNRPLDIAVPKVLQHSFWNNIYKEADEEVRKILKKANFVFQFHSMNSFNPIEKSVFDENVSQDFIQNHIEKVYSGSKRECTLLTETNKGEYITERDFDQILRDTFQKYNITLEENTAYRLLDMFPATEIIRSQKSSIFEVTKWSLATDETKNETDSNNIVFDTEKIKLFWKVFYEILEKYLQKTQK